MTEYIKSMRKHIGHDRLLIAGAGVFVHKDGKLLMQKRKDNGCWADHGGCIELGETAEETAKRELFEETGLTALSLELVGIFSGKELLYTYPNGDMVSIVSIVYLCENFSGEPITQTNETTDLRWFGLDNLPKNISPPTIPALKRCVDLLTERAKSKPKIIRLSFDNSITIRTMTIGDYESVYALWLCTPNMGLNNLDDSKEGIAKYLARNPDTCFVAEKDDVIIGVILSGHDGRRGYIYHAAVAGIQQNNGVGTALLSAAMSALEREGINKVALVVFDGNENGNAFWEKKGFTTRPDLIYRNKAIVDLKIIDTAK